jgi:1-aminocyclopropane-1-carboxylate deaminase/D-cysteine desulfhydrase-like pyridoxal-dependent ACC family enzyme
MSPTDILPPIAKNCTTFSSMGGLKNNHLYEATYTAISFVVRRSDNYKNYGKRYLDEVSGNYGQVLTATGSWAPIYGSLGVCL